MVYIHAHARIFHLFESAAPSKASTPLLKPWVSCFKGVLETSNIISLCRSKSKISPFLHLSSFIMLYAMIYFFFLYLFFLFPYQIALSRSPGCAVSIGVYISKNEFFHEGWYIHVSTNLITIKNHVYSFNIITQLTHIRVNTNNQNYTHMHLLFSSITHT